MVRKIRVATAVVVSIITAGVAVRQLIAKCQRSETQIVEAAGKTC